MSPRPSRVTPHELCVDWPGTRSNDPVAEIARQFVLNLRGAMGSRSIREVARETGVDRASIGALLNGLSWPDIATLAKLELGLKASLWPGVVD
ncbi:helix-turn-helix transcriptional regulator [Cryobacterium sp. Y29]|uniref:helix-turn-helix domain-containing protein n=1 Tax=Cryobacterium sp. Y29 TaxID=2048285 RepID=UPI000CE4FE54|nr:helix-turn-helix transcriptional regulator [Cryobacterium sp. Y29]